MAAAEERKLPQLVMQRSLVEGLEHLALPEGCRLGHYEPGLEEAWERIIAKSFEQPPRPGRFANQMWRDAPFRPERVLFVFDGDVPVATASAWYMPRFGCDAGYLHMVGVLPEAGGRKLGYWASLACLHRMKEEGRSKGVLETDDFRVPAVKTYLRMGFAPRLVHDNQRQRWRDVFESVGQPDLADVFREILDGPLHPPEPAREDLDTDERYEVIERWLPGRVHKILTHGTPDFIADEHLYKPSVLGEVSVSPREVEAGAPFDEPLVLRYTAGSQALQPGAEIRFFMSGQSPLGPHLHVPFRGSGGSLSIEGPAGTAFKSCDMWTIQLTEGRLEPGQSVALRAEKVKGFSWKPVAGPRRIYCGVRPLPGGLEQRLAAPAVIDISAGPPLRLETTIAASGAAEDPLEVRATARDAYDNRVPLQGIVEVEAGGTCASAYMREGLADAILPAVERPLRAKASLSDPDLSCDSNVQTEPMEGMRLFVGDLHCHDLFSEAEGWSDEVYRWAMEDRRLDFVSITPQSHNWHDNETWSVAKYMNDRFLDEGRFVTFLGFEWQHTGYGDKIVHYLGGAQPFLPVDDKRYDSAPKLYEALRRSDALVIGHHPAYPPGSWCSSTDYDMLDADVERLTEIWSMHGSAEGYDLEDRPYVGGGHAENFAMETLRRGVRVGFVGGSDSHSGRPGGSAKEPRPYWGGLAAIWAPELTRRAVFDALYARRTYALTNARIILWMTVNGAPMGSEVEAADEASIRVKAHGCGPLRSVEILKNAELLKRFDPRGETFEDEIVDPCEGPAFYHVRVAQEDGQLAVCSPVWVG